MRPLAAGVEDVEQDNADKNVKLACPTLALWGENSPAINGLFDIQAVWREMARDVSFASIPHCGHLPPEEQPCLVNQALLKFLNA